MPILASHLHMLNMQHSTTIKPVFLDPTSDDARLSEDVDVVDTRVDLLGKGSVLEVLEASTMSCM